MVGFLREKLSEEDFAEFESLFVKSISRIPLNSSIDAIGLQSRTKHILRAEGIDTVGKLIKKTEMTLVRIPNIGPRSIRDVKKSLDYVNLSLACN